MTIYPPETAKTDTFGYHCAGCGELVPLERRYFLMLYQQGSNFSEDGKPLYRQTARYQCPTCWATTELNYGTDASNNDFIRWFNLYTDTLKGNEPQQSEDSKEETSDDHTTE